MKIIGREKEISVIKKCYESEFVAIYGRRRVGKTFLMNNCFNNEFDFKFTATYHSKTVNLLDAFQIEINRLTGKNIKTPEKWCDILYNLKNYLLSLKKDRVVVFKKIPCNSDNDFCKKVHWIELRGF